MNMYLTKDKQSVVAGQKHTFNLSFQAASDDEIKKALGNGNEAPEGYIAGWASTADIDSYNHKVMPGAFSESIRKRGLKGPKSIKLLIGHSWNQLAGEIKVLEYRGDRLWIEAQLELSIGYVRDAYTAAKILGGTNFSVGFMLQDYEWKENSDKSEFLQINRGDLFEVSVVPFPGNEEATMTFIKSSDDEKNPLAKSGNADYVDDDSDGTMSSVSEFEKTLVLNGVVKSRNQAREITKLIKANLKLFEPKEEPVSPTGQQEKTGPVLDLNKITSLSAKLAEMKAILQAPVAQ